MTDAKQIDGVEPADRMLEDAAHDPCMPVRNLAGHVITCNYGDWPSFEKCNCMEGLAGIPAKPPTHVNVASMPLRDTFAMTINISDDHAHDMATGIKTAQAKEQKVQLVGAAMGIEDCIQISCVDIAEARAKLRYLEADAMLHWRVESLRAQAEAEKNARTAAEILALVCVCGHGPDQHTIDEKGFGESEPCGEPDCECEQYTRPEQ